jgi:hypothetical protein
MGLRVLLFCNGSIFAAARSPLPNLHWPSPLPLLASFYFS